MKRSQPRLSACCVISAARSQRDGHLVLALLNDVVLVVEIGFDQISGGIDCGRLPPAHVVVGVARLAVAIHRLDQIAERITQLGGLPNFNPEGLSARSHSQYVEGTSLVAMIREDLVAERIAIESYGEIIRYLGDTDPTSRRVMESILAKEEEHADDMAKLIQVVAEYEEKGKASGPKAAA